MFEVGDAVLLPPEFGSEKKGVLARREPDGYWLVQIGTAGYKFLSEKDLRPLTKVTKCWRCGAQFTPDTRGGKTSGCPVCGAWDRRKHQAKNASDS